MEYLGKKRSIMSFKDGRSSDPATVAEYTFVRSYIVVVHHATATKND
jgi:hypothetical protein